MKMQVKLESGKLSEKQVRDHMEKAAQTARETEQKRGGSDKGHEAFRKVMEGHAERDRKDGKI